MKKITSINITFSMGKTIINPGQSMEVEDSVVELIGLVPYIKAGRIKITDIKILAPIEPKINKEINTTKKVPYLKEKVLEEKIKIDRIIDNLNEAKLYLNQNERTVKSQLNKMKLEALDIKDLIQVEKENKNRSKILKYLKNYKVN